MRIKSVKLVTFSPTGNSTKIGKAVAKGIGSPVEHIDLTPASSKTQDYQEFKDELTIITSPVYIGRVPHETASRLRGLKANNTPAVLVVTYGNRAYEDSLTELSNIASEVGFNPIAAGAFIGEHSWSTLETPTAQGRPDKEDLGKAKEFGKKIKEKYEKAMSIDDLENVHTPSDTPYVLALRGGLRRYVAAGLMHPSTDEELCTMCETCVSVCPTAAISINTIFSNPSPMASLNQRIVSTDGNDCIWCAACVKRCPVGARKSRPNMIAISGRLNARYNDRKEPETYL